MKRLLVVASALFLFLSGIAASGTILVGPVPEQLVEGHTVFIAIEIIPGSVSGMHFAAAVAVLVRERVEERRAARFPGVLWFNDQYLINPNRGGDDLELPFPTDANDARYPCSGAVLAVNDGPADEVPRDANGTYFHRNDSTYIESYLIRDVHDHDWVVDKWRLETGRLLWSVPLMNDAAGYGTKDDGDCQGAAFSDAPCDGMPRAPFVGCAPVGPKSSQYGLPSPGGTYARSPGDNSWNYPCGNSTAPCAGIQYNALLYFRLDDLDAFARPKNHAEDSADSSMDVSGCQNTTTDYPCPEDDDDREGNSHTFNPHQPWPTQEGAGRGNHGGSDDCDGDGVDELDCHGTRLISVAYGYAALPAERYFWLIDTKGSDAPYHCHDEDLCGPDDALFFAP